VSEGGARGAARAIAALRRVIDDADDEMEEANSAVTTAAAERHALEMEIAALEGKKSPESSAPSTGDESPYELDSDMVPHSTSMAGNILAVRVRNVLDVDKIPIGKQD